MIVDTHIDIAEATKILREGIAKKLGVELSEIGDVSITSFGKSKILIGQDSMFETLCTFRHNIGPT